MALKAKLSVKFAGIFVTTQLPKEVYQKAKEWLVEKPEDMGEGEGTHFAVKLRKSFAEKGITMDRGYRDTGPERVIRVRASSSESEGSNTEEITKDSAKVNTFRQSDRFQRKSGTGEPTKDSISVNAFRQSDRVPRKTRPGPGSQGTGCFTCGKFRHGWRYCPERPCGNCGQKGHWTSKCPKTSRKYDRYDRNFKREDAFSVNSNVKAVTLQVKMGNCDVTAMLDTGAKPCVIDRNTLAKLKLDRELVHAPSEVYGLCSSPVQVLGYVDTLIQVDNERPVTQRLRVLDSEERTLLLGRQFMEKFDKVTFDWKGGRIRLGKDWQPAQTMLSGSNALSRARIADEEVLELREATKERELINPNLLPNENKTIKELLKEFTGLFAEDPKKPNRVHTRVQHCLDLEASTPIQVRPKRMPPAWEKTVSEQAKEMCKMEFAALQALNGQATSYSCVKRMAP